MSDLTPAGQARIIKTKRVPHTVTQADIDAGALGINLDAVWDSPFKDTNYTSDQNVAVIPPADPSKYYVNAFQAADKITMNIYCGLGAVGDVVVLHAHAIRD